MANYDTPTTGGAVYYDDALPLADLQIEGRRDFVVEGDDVLLCGSRSRSSGSLSFPSRTVCQISGKRDMESIKFGPRGNLYSFSTVHVSSSRDVPYTLGYVDFENGLRVLAEVRTKEPEALTCDAPVEVKKTSDHWCVVPLTADGGAS